MENYNKCRYKDLSKNVLLFAISSFGTKFLSFLLVPLYTNVLSTAEYGTADLLYTATTLLIVVFTVNISEGVLIFAMDKKQSPNAVLSFGIKVALLGWGLLTIIELVVYSLNIFQCPVYYFVFISIFFLATVFYDIISNFLRAVKKIKEVAISGILSSTSYITCNILFLLVTKNGLKGYLIATAVGPLVAAIYCFTVSHETITDIFKREISVEQKQTILKYCIPLIFNSIALWINSCINQYFITYFCGVDQSGIYSIANKIPVILSTVYTVFTQAWTISAVKEFDQNDKDGFFSKTYEVYNSVMTMTCSFLILINVPLAHILYAKEFFIAWKYSSVLLFCTYFNSLAAFIGRLFLAKKNSRVIASITIISAIINIVLSIIIIPRFGVQGAAITSTISLASMWIISMIKLKEIIKMRVNWTRDIIVLILLIGQIIFEHLNNHMYVIQIIIFILIVFIMIKPIARIAKNIFEMKVKNKE